MPPLRYAVGGRAAPARPPESETGESEEARKLQQTLLNNGAAIAQEIGPGDRASGPVQKIAELQGRAHVRRPLKSWKTDLEGLKANLTTVDGLTGLKDRLTAGWLETPKRFPKACKAHGKHTGQTRSDDHPRCADVPDDGAASSRRLPGGDEKKQSGRNRLVAAKTAYDAYCGVLEHELNTLYEEVQKDFSTFYRAVNEDDEGEFTAKLTPSEGSLGLEVNFYDRGLFPPGAYHSEGHQDGMGVCLYLALMKRLFGKRFTFALLDDVVMSVDTGHRYQFCKLLKTGFSRHAIHHHDPRPVMGRTDEVRRTRHWQDLGFVP